MAKRVREAAAEANMSRNDFDHHYREIIGAEEKSKTAAGVKGDKTKKAKSAGMDNWAWKRMREVERMDAKDALRSVGNLIRYCLFRDLEVGSQLSFFIEDKVKPRTAKEQQKVEEFDVRAEGRAAAEAGQPRDSNPHKAGTVLAQGWDLGWLEVSPEGTDTPGTQTARPPRRGVGAENRPN
jgi:hypothetical protein